MPEKDGVSQMVYNLCWNISIYAFNFFELFGPILYFPYFNHPVFKIQGWDKLLAWATAAALILRHTKTGRPPTNSFSFKGKARQTQFSSLR